MNASEYIGDLIDESKKYVDAKIESIQLEAVEKTVEVSSTIFSWLIILGLVIISVGVLAFVGVIFFAQFMSLMIASLTVLGILVLMCIILAKFSEGILVKPIKNVLLGMYLKSQSKD